MAYTAAELTTAFTNANLGAAPSAAQALLLASYASQTQSGAMTDAAAIQRIVDMMDGTTAVAVQSYQFFTGSTPSVAGLGYLVNSATNTNDLNDAAGQYAPLNTENRYINFAINLGATASGAGQANFAATYGTLSFADVVAVAYETIIGSAAAKAAGIDVAASIAYFSRDVNQTYLRAFVAARAPGVDVELAIRAAVVGQIMSAGATGNVGNYNTATTLLIAGATDGTFDNGLTASAGVNLLTAFPIPVTPTSFALTTGVDTLTGTGGADAFTATNTTLTALDTLDGGAGADTLTISDIAGATTIPVSATIKNIETINVASAGTTALDFTTTPGITGLTNLNVTASTGADSIKSVAGLNVSVVDSAGTVTINGASASQTVTTAGGYILSGSTGAIKVTDTAQAAVASTIDGGTTVDLTTTTTSTGTVTIGGTTKATGAINVTENLKGTGALTGGAITVNGGTVDTVKVNATQATANTTTTVGTITVNGAATATTVNVTQTAPVAPVAAVTAVTGVTETNSAVFVALTAGQTLIAGGLTFTAGAAGTTAAQTAAAFANLTAGATQGNSTLGTYSGTLAGWTSGAVSTATVVFTSTAAGNVADLAFTGTGTAPGLTKVDGVTAVAAVTGVGGIADGAVVVTSSGNVLTTASIDGFSGASSVQSDALTTLSLANSTAAAALTITNTKATTLGLTTSALAAGTTLTAPTYTALNVTTGATKSTLNVTGAAVQTLAVSGATAIDMTGSTFAALKTVTVSGAAGATLDASGATVTSVDTSGSTGTNTFTVDATKATFTGGAGVDVVTTSAAAPTKAISLAGGNDTLKLASGTTAVTGAIDGGAGTDTLSMVAADAVTASATTAFATKVTGFEVLALTGATGAQSVDVSQLGAYTSVTSSASAGTLTVNNLASGGTLSITGDTVGTGYVAAITNATTGTSDVLNLVLSKAGALTAGSVTAANVETVTIAANDTSTTPAPATHTLTLAATKATSVTVTGNANLSLTNTGNVSLTKIDGSAMTGALTVTAAGTVAETILGGSGNDALTASSGTVADMLNGGAGNDVLTSNAGLATLTGGAGRDTFVVATSGANVNVYTTITDASAGDTIQLANKGLETFNATKLVLGDTAVFQDYANLAAAGDGSTNGAISWFQFGGNTYIVEDQSASASFVNGTDLVVKLAGLVDLSATSLNTGTPTLLLG